MKNKRSFRVSGWVMNVLAKAVAIFAVAAGAFYVYAGNIQFPGVAPTNITGVVGQFMGLSTEGFDNPVVDYKTLNEKCRVGGVVNPETGKTENNLGAHVCGDMEVINSYNFNSSVINAQKNGTGIVNTGPPGFTVFANDCNGWTVRAAQLNGTPAFGSLWSFTDKSGSLAACDGVFNNAGVKVACCK